MATTAFVRETRHSFLSIDCNDLSSSPPDPHPLSSESLISMPPTEQSTNPRENVSPSPFQPATPESGDSNDICSAAMYSYSALQRMQAAYGGTNTLLQPSSSSMSSPDDNATSFPKCGICDYVPVDDVDKKNHEATHFPFKCSTCCYMTKTEGRLKNHETKYHSPVPPSTWVGSQEGATSGKQTTLSSGPKIKKRPVTCKTCNLVCSDKNSYYDHLRESHNDPKLLKCDRCPFATNYKHHLEYHVRNHYGSKPFSCDLCNYSCVNKSMLNSHRKSHSNVYQFRCGVCPYVTKYCHSLKMHLNKYQHRPGATLNPDGTPNTTIVIDVNGRRRGPKAKKKIDKRSNNKAPNTKPVFANFNPVSPALPAPVFVNPKVYNNFSGTVFYRPSLTDNTNCSMAAPSQSPPQIPPGRDLGRCPYCNFHSDSGPAITAHIMTHIGMMNKPFFNYGYLSEEMMKMRLNENMLNGNHFASKVDESFRREAAARAAGGSSASPSNGYSSDAYSSPRSNQDAHFGRILQPRAQPQCSSPQYGAMNLAWPKTSSPEVKTPDILKSLKYRLDSVLDLSMKRFGENSDRQRNDSSSSATSQSSCTSSRANDQTVPPTRNRRKGKAFKLDSYMKDEEGPNDFTRVRKETEQILESYVKSYEEPRTSAARSQLPTFKQQKRKVDKSGNDEAKKFSVATPTEESHQPFFNHLSPPFTPSSTITSTHASSSPTQSLTSLSSSSSPDRSYGQHAQSLGAVPKVIIKTEPMDTDSKPQVSNAAGSNVHLKCYYCDLIFGDHAMFSAHNSYHSEGDPFICRKCGVQCYDRIGLYYHCINVPHPNEDADISVVGVVKR